MNQRGEVNLLFVFMVAALCGIFVLCAMKLHRSFSLLEKRTELFLCVKETEGEMKNYMVFMGRTNWALRNIRLAQAIMIFIPGLQEMALEGEKLRKVIQRFQDASLIAYMKKVAELGSRGCPLDPRILQTPFQLSGRGFKRAVDSTARLRNEKWTYQYVSYPYSLSVEWDASKYEAVWPKLERKSSENAAKLSSILSSL